MWLVRRSVSYKGALVLGNTDKAYRSERAHLVESADGRTSSLGTEYSS